MPLVITREAFFKDIARLFSYMLISISKGSDTTSVLRHAFLKAIITDATMPIARNTGSVVP